MNKLFHILFFLFLLNFSHAQIHFAPISIKEESVKSTLQQREKSSCVKYKTRQYKYAFYAALEYYPELKNIHIKVVSRNIKMLMQARPTFISSWRRPKHRKYKIVVNKNKLSSAPIPDNFTFNAQVGVFGHELGHVNDYLSMRCRQLIRYGTHYKKPDFKKKVEQNTDKITLEHGLGWQMYDYSVQWNNLPLTKAKYIEKKKQFYLDPKIMLGIMLDMGYK